jgi:hypothetical protein
LCSVWRDVAAANYAKALDQQAYAFKQTERKALTTKAIMLEVYFCLLMNVVVVVVVVLNVCCCVDSSSSDGEACRGGGARRREACGGRRVDGAAQKRVGTQGLFVCLFVCLLSCIIYCRLVLRRVAPMRRRASISKARAATAIIVHTPMQSTQPLLLLLLLLSLSSILTHNHHRTDVERPSRSRTCNSRCRRRRCIKICSSWSRLSASAPSPKPIVLNSIRTFVCL